MTQTKAPRTDTEILARIKERESQDWLGIEISNLITCLPFKLAKPWLVATATEDDWVQDSRDRETILTEMKAYMPFAWEKANGQRGLSAGRSMSHYMAWAWLLGDSFGDLTKYQYYGKDNLRKICDYYGWDADQWDDGVRVN